MTNEEKALSLSQKYGTPKNKNREIAVYQSCIEMAEWKDRQFREYLEKKKDSLEMDYTKDCFEGNAYKHYLLTEVINELFNNE